MKVDIKLVNELRKKTGAGLMACKNAMIKAGDVEKAIIYLRENGLNKIEGKDISKVKDGLIGTYCDEKCGIIIELDCETDFVSKCDDFKKLSKSVLFEMKNKLDELINQNKKIIKNYDKDSEDIEILIKNKTLAIRERIIFKKYGMISSGNQFSSYIHPPGQMGVILGINIDKLNEKKEEIDIFMKNICLHIVALKPLVLNKGEISEDIINKEKEIYKTIAEKQKKNEKTTERIIEGKINKFIADVTLLDQVYVKNSKLKIKDYISETKKKLNFDISIEDFILFSIK